MAAAVGETALMPDTHTDRLSTLLHCTHLFQGGMKQIWVVCDILATGFCWRVVKIGLRLQNCSTAQMVVAGSDQQDKCAVLRTYTALFSALPCCTDSSPGEPIMTACCQSA